MHVKGLILVKYFFCTDMRTFDDLCRQKVIKKVLSNCEYIQLCATIDAFSTNNYCRQLAVHFDYIASWINYSQFSTNQDHIHFR